MRSRSIPSGGASPSSTLASGTLLAGRYQIEDLIATGGMGAVYRARDRRFRAVVRRCAVKEMFDALPDPLMRQRAVEHFEREANLLASLNHPAIPKVFDYFTEGERHYLVYEHIEGQDLSRVIQQRARPLPPERVVDWAIQLTVVLEHLHYHEPPIVFRDIKPSNVMLRPDGQIVLIDFGIAKHFQPSHRGTMIGTAGYAPPEQYEGLANHKVDIYALGATMHHLLTNTDPQEYRPFSFDQRPIREYNPGVPTELEGIIACALSYDADDRWANMQTFRKALETVYARLMGTSSPGVAQVLPPAPAEPAPSTPAEPAPQPPEDRPRRGTGLFERHLQSHADETGTRLIDEPPPEPDEPVIPAGGGTVMIGTPPSGPQDGGTITLDASSEAMIVPRWTFATEDEVRSTPVLNDKHLYIGSYDTNLYCIDRRTGDFVWKYATGAGIPGTPFLWGELVLIGSEDHHLYAINHETGYMEWSATTGGRIRSSPRVGMGHAVVGSDDGLIYAFHVNRGHLAWRFYVGAPVRSKPAISEDMVFVGAEDGSIVGLDLLDGESRWRIHTGGPVLSSPVLTSERLIVGSMDRQLYGVDQNSGWIVWRVRLSDRVYSSPCLVDERVYVCSVDGTIYCLDAEWGKEVWKTTLDTKITSSPTVDEENRLFVGGTNGIMYCLDARKGRFQWQFSTGGPIPGSPVVRDGLVYFGSLDHRIYSLPTEPAPFRA